MNIGAVLAGDKTFYFIFSPQEDGFLGKIIQYNVFHGPISLKLSKYKH